MDQRSGSHFWLNWSNNISRSGTPTNRLSAVGPTPPQQTATTAVASQQQAKHNNGNNEVYYLNHVKNSPRLDGTPRRLLSNGRHSRDNSATRNNPHNHNQAVGDGVGKSHGTPTHCHYGTPRREPHPSNNGGGANGHHYSTTGSYMTRSGPPAIVYGTPQHNNVASSSVFTTFYPSPLLSRSAPGLDVLYQQHQRCGSGGNSGRGTPVHHHMQQQLNSSAAHHVYATPNQNNNYEGRFHGFLNDNFTFITTLVSYLLIKRV